MVVIGTMVRGMESCPKIATRLRLLNVEAIHPHMLGISSYLEDHPTDRKWLIVSSPIYRWDDKSLNQKNGTPGTKQFRFVE